MTTFIQDYKNWKQARVKARYCMNAMDNYRHEIEVSVPYEEWMGYTRKLLAAYDSLESVQNSVTQTDFDNKYIDEMKKLHAKGCFVNVFFDPLYVPFSESPEIWISPFGLHKCINNKDSGDVHENLCAGCPKFNELVKYQMLVSNAKVAQQRCVDARKTLLGHFKLSKTK